MPTSLVATPNVGTASVALAVAGAPTITTAYSTGFEPAGVDSWVAGGGSAATLSRQTSVTHTGSGVLVATTGGPSWSTPGHQVQRTVTGLTIGVRYRLSLWWRFTGTKARFAAFGDAIVGATSTSGDVWTRSTVEFVATATSQVIGLRVTQYVSGSGSGDGFSLRVDDVLLEALPAGFAPTTITRTDANGTGRVRLLDGQEPISGTMVVDDYEAALTGTITYTLTDSAGAQVSTTTTLEGVAVPWLSVPVLPQLGLAVPMILDDYTAASTSRGTLHDVIDREDPVPALAGLSSRAGSFTVLVGSHLEARAVRGVYGRGHVVQLRQPDHDDLDMYHVAERVEARRNGRRWEVAVTYREVAAPSGPLLGGLGWDWSGVTDTFLDWSAVEASYADWASVEAGTP